MTAALTPDLALAFLRELSADLTAAVVLDAAGERLAGPAALHAPARDLLAAAPPGPAELHGRTAAGAVFAARDDAHQLVVATGPLALPGLTRHDLRATLAALAGHTPEGPGGEPEPDGSGAEAGPAGPAGESQPEGPRAAGRGTPPAAPIEAARGAVERLLAAAARRS
jgi:hypothetical protein